MDVRLTAYPRRAALIAAAVAPAVVFYTLLFRVALNLPFRDDYDTVLGFANGFISQSSFPGKMGFFLAAQSNEYKLYFLHALAILQLELYQKIDFRVLSFIGDSFVLLIAILLWAMFLPHIKDTGRRLTLFLPVCYLLFQFRYEETLNWTTACLQHLPCIFFSFYSIFLLDKKTSRTFILSLILLPLAIGSSGNGFVLAVVGIVLLAVNRRYIQLLFWIAITSCCAAAYAYKWAPENLVSKASSPHAILHIRPHYVLLFIGSIAARPRFIPGILLGVAIILSIIYFAYKRYPERNPAVAYCVFYLLLTAIGVAGLRADVDPLQISTSRYTIYSALFLIFCWFAVADSFRDRVASPVFRRLIFPSILMCCMLFAFVTWYTGLRGLKRNDADLVRGMRAYQHPSDTRADFGPVLPLEHQDASLDAFDLRARSELSKSIQNRIYIPAQY